MPMTTTDFESSFRTLELAYRTKITPQMLASYYHELKHHEDCDLDTACSRLPAYERSFPTASVLLKYVLDAQEGRRAKAEREAPRDIGDLARRCQRGTDDDAFAKLCATMIQVGQGQERQELIATFIDEHGPWLREHGESRAWLQDKLSV